MASTPRDLFTRFATAMNDRDMAALEEMIHPDFVSESPQSGERSRGFAQFWAQFEAYPGGTPSAPLLPDAQLVGDEERWAITPAYTVVPLAARNEFTIIMRTLYPDGVYWYVVIICELRDGKVARMENYFAPEFEPPEWRRPYVEIVPRS